MVVKGESYDVTEVNKENSLKYLFFSNGENDILKAISYDYIVDFKGAPIFNLGFGDFNLETQSIDDSQNSNNGDMHAVLYTVLRTVPNFFEMYPHAIMVVEGSNSSHEFSKNCRKECKKKCTVGCRNLNRRIKTYRYFVNKNYEELKKDYTFFGGTRIDNTTVFHDEYEVGKEYDLVFCKKNIPLEYEN